MLRSIFRAKSDGGFRTRAPERDQATDSELIGGVAKTIDEALAAFQAEQTGLNRRVDQAMAMASLAVGYDTDEYLERDEAKEAGLKQFESEMKAGRDRLSVLDRNISHLRFLRAAFLTRFPGFGSSAGDSSKDKGQ